MTAPGSGKDRATASRAARSRSPERTDPVSPFVVGGAGFYAQAVTPPRIPDRPSQRVPRRCDEYLGDEYLGGSGTCNG
ncbi:hypothetical protein GCM10009609_45970 [Pseudonocardia aurantiaca]